MKYLLVITLVCYGLTYWAKRYSDHGQMDDFGTAIPAILAAFTSVFLTLAYVGLALWNHRFW